MVKYCKDCFFYRKDRKDIVGFCLKRKREVSPYQTCKHFERRVGYYQRQ